MNSENTTPPKADGAKATSDEEEHDDAIDPMDEMEAFDWEELESRYMEAMHACKAGEEAHLQEFESLSQYFELWAETISGHEQQRSYARLKTQSTFVQHQEDELERRRLHYIHVVKAFREALSLLDH